MPWPAPGKRTLSRQVGSIRRRFVRFARKAWTIGMATFRGEYYLQFLPTCLGRASRYYQYARERAALNNQSCRANPTNQASSGARQEKIKSEEWKDGRVDEMERRNINRGYRKLTVWQDAVAYYAATCETFRSFSFVLQRVASQAALQRNERGI